MWGFGDKYWHKVIYKDCEKFCKNNNIKFSIDPSIKDEGAAGMFLYKTKETMIELKNAVDDYNVYAKILNDMGEKINLKPDPEAELEIKLDGNELNISWLVFLHEIGHYILYRDNLKQIERYASHYRIKYFKDKPKWMAWQERRIIAIYAGTKDLTVEKYLSLNRKLDIWYNLQNWYYKKLHKKGKWNYDSIR